MKPLIFIAIIAVVAFVLLQAEDSKPKASQAICPECPGGVCPAPLDKLNLFSPNSIDGSLSLQEKIVPVGQLAPNRPTQVEPVPVFTLAKHDKSLIKPVAPTNTIKEGPKGWRLRLIYTAGDKQAEKLVKWFNNRMPVITKKYGFMPIDSNSEHYAVWKSAGYNSKKPVLVLACPDDTVALRTDNIPDDIEELRTMIREAAAKFQDHVPVTAVQ